MLFTNDRKAGLDNTMDPLTNFERAVLATLRGLTCAINDQQETFNLQLPLFDNIFGLSALDYSCGVKKSNYTIKEGAIEMNNRFKPLQTDDLIKLKESQNEPLTRAFFANTKQYDFLS